jgi:hypothetical protein
MRAKEANEAQVRLRNSRFGRRNGPTARFRVAGFTNRRFDFAGILASYRSVLLVY